MRIRRSDIRSGLRDLAQSRVDPPSSGFVDRLEQQLRTTGAPASAPSSSNVLAFRRRISRGAAIGILAGAMSAAGAAAVAIVAVRHDDAPALITTTTTTAQPTGSTDAVHPAPPSWPATTTSSEPPATTTTATATTTTPSTEPAPTEPPATTTPAPATATTEIQVAASLQLSCVPSSATIGCAWSAVPAGTDHVIVLRSTPGEARGRVLFPDAGANSITDGGAAPGATYTYLVHAMDASNTSLAHSNPVTVTCCG